ncbi:MAG: hypothetical protein V4533_10635 [Pseudomonadota bacterium]|jgi:hypothetical protein
MILATPTPRFLTSRLPPEEKEKSNKLKSIFNDLVARVAELDHAVALYGVSMKELDGLEIVRDEMGMPTQESMQRRSTLSGRYVTWGNMGARCGAMAVYSFYQILQAAGAIANKCPTIIQYQDHDIKRAATKLFDANFPNFAGVRYHAAHPGEPAAKGSDAHSINTGVNIEGVMDIASGVQVFMSGTMIDDHYTCTYEGNMISYHVHIATVNKLMDVLLEYFRSFEPLAAHHAALLDQEMQLRQQQAAPS